MIHLVCGPPGSGKTAFVLSRAREFLSRTDSRFLLLVPTATFAEHTRNLLAREGFVLDPRSISTLSGFVARHSPESAGDAPPAFIDLLLRQILPELRISHFESVRRYPGFRDRLARTIDEFGTAGISAQHLSEACAAAGLGSPEIQGVLRVYTKIESELRRRKLVLRGEKILRASRAIAASGLRNVSEVCMDGFYAFSAPERELLLQISRDIPLTITIPDGWPQAAEAREFFVLQGATVQSLAARFSPPAVSLVSATSREAEAHEVARRIAALHRQGTALREIGVILRGEQPYVPVLRSVFSRFGIPARFYFPRRLENQAPVRLLASVVEAVLSGWDRERVIEIVRYNSSGLGGTFAGDQAEQTLAAAIPGRGLDPAGSYAEVLHPIADWGTLHRSPKNWASALGNLTRLIHPGRVIQPASHEEAAHWRIQAETLESWKQVLEATAEALPVAPVSLSDFWQEVRESLRLAVLRNADGRRNVVQVMDVFEARQWRLQHVFVCGLLEGEFPRFAAPETFFGETARDLLREQGIALRTARDRQAEEDQLFESAIHRAPNVVLSWPAFNEKGEETLPSFAMDRFAAAPQKAPPSRPRPARDVVRPPMADYVPPELIEARLGSSKKWSASEIERFLQCPFLHFSERSLRLAEPAKLPSERFTPREHGSLVHAVLYELHRDPHQSLDALFDRMFREACRKDNVPENHRIEWARLTMLRSLRAFLESHEPPAGWKSYAEYQFEFPLIEGLVVRGRIDRFDEDSEGNVIATDFKYSGLQRAKDLLKSEEAVQGGLYLLALKNQGKNPVRFRYVPLRGGSEPIESEDVAGLMETARERTIDAVARVRQGHIAVRPADPDACRYCAMRTICRVSEQAAGLAAASEESEWD